MSEWHQMACGEVFAKLGSDPVAGLTAEEAALRLSERGPNDLIETGGRGAWRILGEQFSSAMVVLLIVAALVSGVLQEYTDSVVILAIIVLNAALGFFQDYRAERALAALKKLAVPVVRVNRDARLQEISARELVPGDLVLLEVGNFVPADGRLTKAVNLSIDEAALTGESAPVEKQAEPLSGERLVLGDRNNMAYMGTVVTYGRGQLIVTETGMQTELGRIASSLQTIEAEQTPLQKRLAQFGRSLALIAVGIVSVVFALGLLRGEETRLMLMTALSLAVAVVPEGLPAVATVALAIGARRMFHRRALIRRLPAVETLGSVTIICSDKTGTLTENRMAVAVLEVAGQRLDFKEPLHLERPADEMPESEVESMQQQVSKNTAYPLLLAAASLCNDAILEFDDSQGHHKIVGDPTEGALVVAADRLGMANQYLLDMLPRVAEFPFDSERKRMTTIHQVTLPPNEPPVRTVAALWRSVHQLDAEYLAFTKGAVDSLIHVCSHVWTGDRAVPMNDDWRSRIEAAHERLAGDGMRVLGAAFRLLSTAHKNIQDIDLAAREVEQKLTFAGMVGMIDPARPEVAEAVARCRSAGIRPLMITGDHPLTASHIAEQLEISGDRRVITGQQLEQISSEELPSIVESTSVFARVAPKHKLRLVQTLQDLGHVVAMTGDGVNDAPALRQAHIGVAMGITGTDVSKEASQMVLLDDNFATIVNAVEEGRIVYDNIRKFIRYTMTSNAGEIWVMLLGPLAGMPLPLLPLQILWVNLVTDGLPGLALAVERAESDAMRRPPYPPEEPILGRGMGKDIAWIGLLMGVVSLAVGYWYWAFQSADEAHWRTIVFTVLTFGQLGNALSIRSARQSVFQIGIFSNKWMVGSLAFTFALQLAVIYWPPLQRLFQTTALTLLELLLCICVSTIVLWSVEAQKLWQQRRYRFGRDGARD